MHAHDLDHSGHVHPHGHDSHTSEAVRLGWALIVILGFAVVEATMGQLFNSVALLSDAGHMLSDAAALAIALAAAIFSKRPPSRRHSYGLVRIEVVGAFINGLAMLLLVVVIGYTAFDRMLAPRPVHAVGVIVVALLGLIVNMLVFKLLHREDASLNARAAVLHVMADLLGSVAALSAGVTIYFTGWSLADPLLSVFICVLILFSTFRLLRQVLAVLLEAVPAHLDLREVGYAMAGVQGVHSVHDLHIWSLSSGQTMLSAHIVIGSIEQWPVIFSRLVECLNERYDIRHVTLQPEPEHYRLVRMDSV